jgi:hypothetical protein
MHTTNRMKRRASSSDRRCSATTSRRVKEGHHAVRRGSAPAVAHRHSVPGCRAGHPCDRPTSPRACQRYILLDKADALAHAAKSDGHRSHHGTSRSNRHSSDRSHSIGRDSTEGHRTAFRGPYADRASVLSQGPRRTVAGREHRPVCICGCRSPRPRPRWRAAAPDSATSCERSRSRQLDQDRAMHRLFGSNSTIPPGRKVRMRRGKRVGSLENLVWKRMKFTAKGEIR